MGCTEKRHTCGCLLNIKPESSAQVSVCSTGETRDLHTDILNTKTSTRCRNESKRHSRCTIFFKKHLIYVTISKSRYDQHTYKFVKLYVWTEGVWLVKFCLDCGVRVADTFWNIRSVTSSLSSWVTSAAVRGLAWPNLLSATGLFVLSPHGNRYKYTTSGWFHS